MTKLDIKIIWNQMLRDHKIQLGIEKKNKQTIIKRMRIKFDIKIKWNQMMRGRIKEKNQ
jgi:hypothetical protein